MKWNLKEENCLKIESESEKPNGDDKTEKKSMWFNIFVKCSCECLCLVYFSEWLCVSIYVDKMMSSRPHRQCKAVACLHSIKQQRLQNFNKRALLSTKTPFSRLDNMIKSPSIEIINVFFLGHRLAYFVIVVAVFSSSFISFSLTLSVFPFHI